MAEQSENGKSNGDKITVDLATGSHTVYKDAHPHISSGSKIERQNTGESSGHDVTNRNIALLQ